jgi:hypothetical protein
MTARKGMTALPGENKNSQGFQDTNKECYPFIHDACLGYVHELL